MKTLKVTEMTADEFLAKISEANENIDEFYSRLHNSVSSEDRNICREYIRFYENSLQQLMSAKIYLVEAD